MMRQLSSLKSFAHIIIMCYIRFNSVVQLISYIVFYDVLFSYIV